VAVARFTSSFFGPPTLVDLLRLRAERQPDDITYTFLLDGEEQEIPLSNWELDRQARAIAARLQDLNMAGERALLLYPSGLDFVAAFFGCLYAGVIAVPAYPPRMNRSLYRIQAIAADAQAKIALTTRSVIDRVNLSETPDLQAMRWEATDELPGGVEDLWREPDVSPETLAFLQYTSGSTGTPKGVMVSHGNLLHNSALIAHAFEHTRSDTGVHWLPCYHDMGLIGGILQPLYVNRPAVLMPPVAFLQRPIRWLRAISKYRACTSGGPNFAYDLCVDKIKPEQREGLDLSCWKVACNGAEPVRAETIDRFTRYFADYGFRRETFYPSFGLAEATLIVTGGYKHEEPVVVNINARELEQGRAVEVSADHPDVQRMVSSGKPLMDQDVRIVDPKTFQECEDGAVGEIWVRGPSVAQGYWNREDATQETFRAQTASGEGPFLRTGDLGFRLEGEIFCAGRLKDLIIIRGLNHYPQDIEATVAESHPALKGGSGAAFTIEKDGGEQLVIVQEIDRRQTDAVAEAITLIRKRVSERHQISADTIVLIKANSIPKTSSGKIQRHACRRAFLDGTLTVVAQWPGDVELLENVELPESPEAEQPVERPRRAAKAAKPAASTNGAPSAHHTAESAPRVPGRKYSREEAAEIVLEEVRKIARERAEGLTLKSTFSDIGMDSLERIELQAALEDRFGGRMPEDVGPELESMDEVVDAVQQYLGATEERQRVAIEDIPAEHYQFDQHPEYERLEASLNLLEQIGLTNPYFAQHERVTTDTTVIGGRELINFSSYNYVGMSGDPYVIQATKEAIDRYGTSVSASRLVSGEKPLHRELEQAIANWVGAEDSIVFVGGHSTNESTIGHLFGPGDLILHDALAHNSILQGCALSGARRRAFPHNDWQALERMLADLRGEYRRVLVVIEGVYSMDGDYPDLPRFIDIKSRYKSYLMVDEAHSMGTMGEHGRGIGEHFDINPRDVDIWMGTLSKSFGSCGGYIAGNAALVKYLKYTAPGFVYSVGISPPNAAAALAAIKVLQAEPQRVQQLAANAELFLQLANQHGLNTGMSQHSPVVPVILGNSEHSLRLSRALFDRGINVQPILYPAVEESKARLRFFITSLHTEEQIRYTVETVAEELAKIDPQYLAAATN